LSSDEAGCLVTELQEPLADPFLLLLVLVERPEVLVDEAVPVGHLLFRDVLHLSLRQDLALAPVLLVPLHPVGVHHLVPLLAGRLLDPEDPVRLLGGCCCCCLLLCLLFFLFVLTGQIIFKL
jgi:hypothetical protein